jgi:hypothetical protein
MPSRDAMQAVIRRRLVWAALAVVITAPCDSLRAQQVLLFQPPPGWVLAPITGIAMEYMKPGEKGDAWTELVTVQSLPRSKTVRLAEFYDALKATRSARCPDLTEWDLIEQSDESLLYEWRTRGMCEGHPPQVELARLVLTRDSFYRVAYATRGALTAEARTTWLAWLRSQKVRR